MTGRRAALAGRLLDRAAAHDRYAEAVLQWAKGDRLALLRAVRHNVAASLLDVAASALGYRRGDSGGLELPAQRVLAGAAVVKCATGHDWPASIAAVIEVEVRGVRVPARFDVCADCAQALSDAGLLGEGL